MSKSIKFTNDTYLDSSGVVFDKEPLDKILTYSTEEQMIGKWIDGKLLYKKTIVGTITAGTNVVDSTINSNNHTLIKIEGQTTNENGTYHYSVPWYESTTDFINFSLNPNGFRVHAGSNNAGRTYKTTVYYTKNG